MSLIHEIENLKKIAIVGLAKNTGKTVVLQSLIANFNLANISIGVTSIGHDGEEFDQINNLIKKPQIEVMPGNLVCTTDELFNKSESEFEILIECNYRTPLGKVKIGKITKKGKIEIAGPSTALGINEVSNLMLTLGAERIIIDGAINRKAIAQPNYIDGVILATGSVLNKNLQSVIKETADKINLLILPKYSGNFSFNCSENGTRLFSRTNGSVFIYDKVLLRFDKKLSQLISNPLVNLLFTNSIVTENFLDNVVKLRKNISEDFILILKDHTKLFLESKRLDYYLKRKIIINVCKSLKLIAITINPVAPLSHKHNSNNFRQLVMENFANVPVYDVLQENTNTFY